MSDRLADGIAAAFNTFDPTLKHRDSEETEIEYDVVLIAADSWKRGEITLADAARAGAILSPKTHRPSPAYTRFRAYWKTRKDPRNPALRELIDAIELDTHGRDYNAQGHYESSYDQHYHDESIAAIYPDAVVMPTIDPWD